METIIVYILLTILLPLIGSVFVPLITKFMKEKVHYYAISISVISFITAAITFILGYKSDAPIVWSFNWIPSLKIIGGIYFDHFSLIMLLLVSFVAMLIVFFSRDYMRHDESLSRYYFFILFFIGNMLGIISSDNMLQMFIFWEGVGLCSYALIGFWNQDDENVKSGNKAFIVTRAGDIGLLAAIILIYTHVGTLNFSEFDSAQFAEKLGQSHLLVIVGILIFIGVIGKSAQFPLQFWLPEAMAGPSTVSALIHAATMVKAGVYLMGRILPFFLSAKSLYAQQIVTFFTIVACVGVFTAFFAGTIGMAARQLKKILAFSTISQLGYMIMGIGIAGLLFDSQNALFAAIFHMTSHMAFKALLFLGAGAILHSVSTTKDIFEMGGIKKYMPRTTIVFIIGGLSLSGIPPLAGYFSKESLFKYLLDYSKQSSLGTVILILATIAAIFTFFYTLRMIGKVFFGTPSEHVITAVNNGKLRDPGFFMLFPLYSLAVFSIVWGFFGWWLEEWMGYSPVSWNNGFRWLGEIFSSPVGWLILGVILVFGGIPGYLLYIRNSDKKSSTELPNSIVYKFLYNRWYWNKLMMKVFVAGSYSVGDIENGIETTIDKATRSIAKGTIIVAEETKKFDEKGVNKAYSNFVELIKKIVRFLSKFEIGDISSYLWIGILGFAMVLALILIIIYV